MKTPDDVAEMLRLKACGWGLKRIARHLGCSHHTVKVYVAAGGEKIKAFVFVAALGHSRRLHVRAFRVEKQEHL
jgi:hypothetical protein